jgi:teichuronic acid biosynthesis glycosyltransferase TuaC
VSDHAGEGVPDGRDSQAGTHVVWLTTAYPWSGDPVAGIFHRTAARSLIKAGVAVTVIAPTPVAPWPLPRMRERWRRYADAPGREVDNGVEVVRPRYLAVPGDPVWSRSDGIVSAVTRRLLGSLPEPDLIHAHDPAPMGMAAWRLRRSSGLPYLVTLHGSDEVWRSSHRSRLPSYRRALRAAARVVAVSQSLADEARGIAAVDALVLPIGIELDRFTSGLPPRALARSELGLPPERVLILLIATLLPGKGIRPFVDALIGLGRPFLGVIVGEGPEFGYRAAEAADVVTYRGMQPNDLIPRYLAAADMLILPSATEGLPTVLVEAGAAHVPVIASAVGGIPELLADDRGLLLPEVSPGAIADALRAVHDEPRLARDRADRLHRFVVEAYDAARNGRRLADVYRAILADPSLAGRRPTRG